ncbi:MAG: DUF3857 domain-containing protein [Terracidiphilus sp.]|nr:DUF3857 domain-containing protein [Terracidiphilus sp.]
MFLCALFLFLFAASPLQLHAQFQQPSAEELKMTTDPKAPGAAAVFLDFEETTDDQLHYYSFYERIKVLQEKGKELATVSLPYLQGNSKIGEIKGRTIHSDGTVIPLTVKPEDLLTLKEGDKQYARKVFTLPGAEVGSILEIRYQIQYDEHLFSSPTWEVQRPYFVHKAHYAFTPFKGFLPGIQNMTSSYLQDSKGHTDNKLVWWMNLPKDANFVHDAVGHFTLDMTDIPQAPDEEWMPPIRSVLYKVAFYYTFSSKAEQFWQEESKRWSKDVDHFAEVSKPIKEAVSGLIAPGDSDLVKAKKLYAAVEALDNTDYSRKKTQSELKQLKLKVAKRAEDTWAQKSGSSEDIAQLYLAMARAAGLTAYAMKVVDRSQGIFDATYFNVDQLDTTLVLLSIGGQTIPVDPGEKMCPFQTLNWRHSNAYGLRQDAKSQDLSNTPLQDYKTNLIQRNGDIALDAHGAMTGRLQFILTGQEALRWRQKALEYDLDEVKKQFDRELESTVPEGVEAHIDHFLGLDDPDVNLMAVIKVQGTLGAATSKRLLLPGFFFQSRGHQPFVAQEKRLEPVDMQYGEQTTDEIVYHLPAGLTVEGVPQDATNLWAGHAVCITKTVSAPGQITVVRKLARAFTEAKAAEYQDLRGFYQKVAAADQQQIVLTSAATATVKGN